MGKTLFNPITTKWKGSIGGFRYSVLRGKQVISERSSSYNDRKSSAQMNTRVRFKLATQFSALWKRILEANQVRFEPDRTLARANGTQVAFNASEFVDNNAALLDIYDFENAFNAKTRQVVPADLSLVFTSVAQSITARDGMVVTYQIVAFDANDNPIGFNTVTYTSDGTAKVLDLPVIKGNAVRYDCIAFGSTVDTTSAWDGPLSNLNGDDPLSLDANTYAVLISSLSTKALDVTGIITGSFLVTP